MKRIGLVIALGLGLLAAPHAQTARSVVVISDLHFGPGHVGAAWSAFEDFRWPRALEAFLAEIGRRSGNRTDLVIAGDLLELWQHPSVACVGPDVDHGCTRAEIVRATEAIVAGHTGDFALLGNFARTGENHLYIVPGNHDAALLLSDVAARVLTAINGAGHVTLVSSGRWWSPGNRIVVEHGHQIGSDPNRFDRWPAISSTINGTEVLERPWGEQFVQELFNNVELSDPLIDNLLPLSEGVKLYMGQRGVLGSALDVVRFIRFNAWQTSSKQRIALGTDPTRGGAPAWNVSFARNRGYQLFADALADDDPLRVLLLDGASEQSQTVRASLNELARDEAQLPVSEVLAMCDAIVVRKGESTQSRADCGSLGSSIAQSIVPVERIITEHLASLGPSANSTELFIYGHTHELKFNWSWRLPSGRSIMAFNTGAFQRLIDPPTLKDMAAAAHVDYGASLRSIPLEALPACYAAVIVDDVNGRLDSKLQNWVMTETDTAGRFVDPCDARCPSAHTASCPKR